MLQLVITVLAVTLVSVLAAASVYYGGDSYTSSGRIVDTAVIVTDLQQIHAAWGLYRQAKGVEPSDGTVTAGHVLVTSKIMADPPLPPVDGLNYAIDLTPGAKNVNLGIGGGDLSPVEIRSLCDAINEKAGISPTPEAVSSTAAAAVAEPAIRTFGCLLQQDGFWATAIYRRSGL